MPNFEQIAIEEALRSELGESAQFSVYDRTKRTPMNFVLDEIERQIGPRFSVYWVDGGAPEVFCLSGFSPSPVVFSTRYLSLTAFVRHLFVDHHFEGEILIDIASRTALKVIAEMALRHGDPDFAVLSFVKSLVGKGIWLNDDDQVMSLEHEPIHENYMTTWFYGLAHELGHLQPNQELDFQDGHFLSDAAILTAITTSLEKFSSYPASIKAEAIDKAKQQRADSVLGIDQVRSEGIADMFAASILFKTTAEIMREIGGKNFEIQNFISEIVVFLNVIAVIDRCRRMASIASATTSSRDAAIESALHPVSVMVRGLIQRQYLDFAVAGYLFGDTPTSDRLEQVEHLINEINQHYAETISHVDTGVSRAMEFALFPERREHDWALLESLRREIVDSSTPALPLMELRRFYELADSLKVESRLLKVLKAISDSPSQPVAPDPLGDMVYFVPWVEGPNGFNRPFGLDTKHGHLVFAFHRQDGIYDAFFEPSAGMLQPGFTLKRAVVPVPRPERLGPELSANMPKNQAFRIIVEGTSEFSQYMKELGDGTIWDD